MDNAPVKWVKLRETIYVASGNQSYGVIVRELSDNSAVVKPYGKCVKGFDTFEEATKYVEQNWGNL